MSQGRRKIGPARAAAFRTLRAIDDERLDLGEALSRARDPLADPRDRALATELATGVLRWRAALDHQLAQRSARPLARLDAPVLDALRLAAYQLLHLERVPVSAAVNDSVEIIKRSGLASAGSFVNGVLRRLARDRAALTWPERPRSIESDADRAALAAHLAVVHSHPLWLVERWLDRHGVEATESFLQFNNQPAPLTLAANRLRGTRDTLAVRLRDEGIESSATAVAPYGLRTSDARVLSSDAFRAGDAVVMDEASQIVPELVLAPAGARVLDACAAPGGKTLALAAQVGETGVVVAADVRPRRVRLLSATMVRTGATRVRVVHTADRGHLPFQLERFDRVLVDAPCSGLGTIRRDPDIRWRRTPDDLPELAAAQRDLLTRVSPLVAHGGRLIYSTCSSEPDENEAVVHAFLAEHPHFVLIPLSELAALPPPIAAMATPDGFLRTTPAHGLEMFFGAVLGRRH
jgi:16S rRNA (cytosine967-C5)-methyltransferase